MTAALKILLICILAAVVYGIIHDQFTARICVEYFTIGHEPIFGTENPTLLGLGWGVIATWWMGAFLGVPMAVACRAGKRPKIEPAAIIRPLGRLLLVMGILATISGLTGYLLASAGKIQLWGTIANRVPADRHVVFLADLWAHNMSYASGFFGGWVVIARTWHKRRKAAISTNSTHQQS